MKGTQFFHVIAAMGLAWVPVKAREPLRSFDQLREMEGKVSEVAKRVMPATVALLSEQVGASGSGVIVNKDGLILTAAHVTDGSEEVLVVFADGRQTKARVLGANYSKDIGMAQIEEKGAWPFVEMGESRPLAAGDWVIAMGHSEGYDASRTPPVRFGRVVSDGPGNFLTTDCELIGGDSGGPLYDLDGKVVGINSSIGLAAENNNHAGIDGFREDWDRLLAGESWGELQLNPLMNPERVVIGIEIRKQRRDGAVEVGRVTPGTPAAAAGILPGDVIVSVDGSRLRSGQALQVLLAKHEAGDTISMGIERGGQVSRVELGLMRLDELLKKIEE